MEDEKQPARDLRPGRNWTDLRVFESMLGGAAQAFATGSPAIDDLGMETVRRVFHELGKWLEKQP